MIIPTYNERENLPLIHRRVVDACPHVHVLIVDDNSPDGTGRLADELVAADPDRIHVLHRTAKNGLGAAYLEGFAWGLSRGYSVLVEMDADGSHAPEQLHRLLDAVDAGADLSIGSRYVPGARYETGRGSAWPCPRRPTPIRGSRSVLGCTTSPPATGLTAVRCWRRSTSPASTPRATASRSR
ncbi:glycosyl transferase 2 family protein [Mycobacterium ulcerans str. Harvey]|uniref:Glycosyl transferase 2 family protein n=1 Tax=Mycobacterium ulcerans str. Harvey TaxID=1299332 RepID=A0ABP3AJ45_MYCUL|nr:glycosyl transferase 2 family protein [Mycobacterium ulcerans str. Harvey]